MKFVTKGGIEMFIAILISFGIGSLLAKLGSPWWGLAIAIILITGIVVYRDNAKKAIDAKEVKNEK